MVIHHYYNQDRSSILSCRGGRLGVELETTCGSDPCQVQLRNSDGQAIELTDQSPARSPSISGNPAIELTDNSTDTEQITSKSPMSV